MAMATLALHPSMRASDSAGYRSGECDHRKTWPRASRPLGRIENLKLPAIIPSGAYPSDSEGPSPPSGPGSSWLQPQLYLQ